MSPRTPLMKAEATGRTLHDPKRFRSRREPIVGEPLGSPPKWMKDKNALKAWDTLAQEIPWLNRSHRTLVEIAASIRGRLMAGDELNAASYNLLRLCISQMGATPVDSSKITLPDDGDSKHDPADKYFN